MKKLITFTLLSLPIFLYSQDYKLPDLKKYDMDFYFWDDSTAINQKAYWANNNLKVDYIDFDGKKIRREYFEAGGLKLAVEIYQVFQCDTLITTDPITGELIKEIYKGYRDIPNGEYFEYAEPTQSNSEIIITVGQYLNGERFGKWFTKDGSNSITANFNKTGQLDGEYIEYYPTYQNINNKIKWKGQFGVIQVNMMTTDILTGQLINETVTKNERIGTWSLYDIGGNIICNIKYNWKK